MLKKTLAVILTITTLLALTACGLFLPEKTNEEVVTFDVSEVTKTESEVETTVNTSELDTTEAESSEEESTIDGETESNVDTTVDTTEDILFSLGGENEYNYMYTTFEHPKKWHWWSDVTDAQIIEHISYMYAEQTEISDNLDTSKLTKIESEVTVGGNLATFPLVDNKSAVVAFTAPDDGTYNLDFAYTAGCTDPYISDGVTVFVFAEGKLLYSMTTDDGLREGDTFSVNAPLHEGDKVYFVADTRKSADGDVWNVKIEATKQTDTYIDNLSAWGFGLVYDNGSRKQGTNGWYAGYTDGDPYSEFDIDDGHIPEYISKGIVFFSDEVGFAQKGAVIWEAPYDGQYDVIVSLACVVPFDGGLITVEFAAGDSIISTHSVTSYEYNTYSMTVNLKKDERFTVAILNDPHDSHNHVAGLEVVIEKH